MEEISKISRFFENTKRMDVEGAAGAKVMEQDKLMDSYKAYQKRVKAKLKRKRGRGKKKGKGAKKTKGGKKNRK